MKNYTYLLITVLISTLTFSCGKSNEQGTEKEELISVTVAQVHTDENDTFLSVSGKIQAENSADLSTRTMGFVNNVPVNVGDKVNKGQLLVAINNADLQAKKAQVDASIAEAQVAYNNAEKDFNRFKNLFSENSATQKELDDMTARFEMAKARLESAKQMKNEVNAQFAYTNIIAPFSGVITSKTVETGDMANPGQPLISIEAPGTFEVVGSVPEVEISNIKTATKVNVVVKSINKTISGYVTEVSASAKNTGGQYLVKVSLDKTDENILSGMFATIQFPVERKANTGIVLIPSDVLINNGQLTGVYTVSQSNTAILRWFRLGRVYGDQVEVL
ncbi:MAG: efflux RND transporter periplasmic adaptor subunit, partial [Flavobacteriaceae bacterium]